MEFTGCNSVISVPDAKFVAKMAGSPELSPFALLAKFTCILRVIKIALQNSMDFPISKI